MTVEKSRFIAYCKPIATEAEALQFIEGIKKKHWDAAHNVPVYVLGEKYDVQRYSDDGEPSGTAGIPVLSMLKNEGITNVVVVITRYFGGIKLGTGGLVRAYTQAAKAGLEACRIVDKVQNAMLKVTVSYHLHGKLQNYLLSHPELIVEETDFSDMVTVKVFTSPELAEGLISKLTDLCNGQIDIFEAGMLYLSVHHGEVLEKTPIE